MTLKEARKKCGGYTQPELAEKVGVCAMTVCNWEKGRTAPNLIKWKKVAEVLGLDVNELEFEEK